VGGRPVLIALRVRRFRCQQFSCPRITFAEQAEGLTCRYRRRSVPLMQMLAGFGLEMAGRAAARLAGLLGVAVHPSTVLRLVTALPEPQITAAPEVLGVDLSGVLSHPSVTSPAWPEDLFPHVGVSLSKVPRQRRRRRHDERAWGCSVSCLMGSGPGR
jgi:hypothetical protein